MGSAGSAPGRGLQRLLPHDQGWLRGQGVRVPDEPPPIWTYPGARRPLQGLPLVRRNLRQTSVGRTTTCRSSPGFSRALQRTHLVEADIPTRRALGASRPWNRPRSRRSASRHLERIPRNQAPPPGALLARRPTRRSSSRFLPGAGGPRGEWTRSSGPGPPPGSLAERPVLRHRVGSMGARETGWNTSSVGRRSILFMEKLRTSTALWAHDRAAEKAMFEDVRRPGHRPSRCPTRRCTSTTTPPYEPTAIKRLMGRHATREDEVDRLLRGGVFVEPLPPGRPPGRSGLSGESYSIKQVEKLYMPAPRRPRDGRRLLRRRLRALDGKSRRIDPR